MNFPRYIGAAVALFIFMFFYEGFVNGMLLMGLYQQTASVWRPLAEMQANLPLMLLFQILIAFWVAFAFTQFFPEGGINKALLFGILFGVFAGLLTASWYQWLPVPSVLGWGWFFSGLVEGIGGGFILGLIYRR